MIEKVVYLNRVSKTVKGGRVMKFSALVVVGDGKGTVGYGLGKAAEVSEAILKGIANAKKNMVTISLAGTTKISDVFSVTTTGLTSSKVFVVSYGNKNTIITSSGVAADTYSVRSSLIFSEGGSNYILDKATVGSMIKTADKSSNTLTLTRFDGTTLSFSSATTLKGLWSGQTYTVTASPQNSKISVTISSIVTMQQGECYAYATWTTPSSTTPSSISGTSKKLTIVNSTDNTVKLQSAGSDVGYTFTHNKYTTGYSAGYNAGNTAGYNSAHVTGSWNGRIFTYSKTTSGSSNTSSITISSVVAMQQGECYAYATWTSPSSTTPSSISGTSKKLTIVNSGDNAVKLQSAGSDVGYTFTHNKYTAGYNAGNSAGYTSGYNDGNTAGYNSGYETGWKAGWNAYYNDTEDWISAWGSGTTKEVYIPRSQGTGSAQYDYYNSPYGRGKGNGSNATCVKWFDYSGSQATYYGRTMVCTDIQATYPGSSSRYYYFRLEGNYAFTKNTNYTMYRTSWPT